MAAAGRRARSERPEAIWLGELIRSRRRGRFSIETLARRSGISAGLLSDIERGRGNPSYFTLLKLANALEIQPSDFFRTADAPHRDDRVVRMSERQKMSFPDGRWIEILSPRLDLPIVMWRSVYPPEYDGREHPQTITAETTILVTRGELVLEDEDGTVLRLRKGDSIRLEAGDPFEPRNPGGNSTECVETSFVAPL